MRRFLIIVVGLATLSLVWGWAKQHRSTIPLPSSKSLSLPVPGFLARTNSFPANIAISPDGRYAALLNGGYGTQESGARQSIAILDLKKNKLVDFPDDRLKEEAHQSYFLGMAFSTDGRHLFASMASITDPEGAKLGNTGNGIVVYNFADGVISGDRFIKIAPQPLAQGKQVLLGVRKTAPGTAIPYPAGLAIVASEKGDKLLVANNLSDNVILLDVATGHVEQHFDLSTDLFIPYSFPYTVVVSKDGTKAWCSLWNSSQVVELDLTNGTVGRRVTLLRPEDPLAPGSHPTAMLLSGDGKRLYVALANADAVAVVDTAQAQLVATLDTHFPGQEPGGSTPQALALSPDGKRLFAANGGMNAIAMFDVSEGNAASLRKTPLGFIPTEWYPSALAFTGKDLLIATAKGKGASPNNGLSALENEQRRHAHPYIATLIGGSVARLSLGDIEKNLDAFTAQVRDDNLFRADSGKMSFASGPNPIKHVIYVMKENRTYDQVLGDLKVGNGDPSLTMYGADITPNQHKLALQFGVLDNFYDSGEVSGDGHVWSTAAITSDYNEKTWTIGYRSSEHTYDFQGLVAEEMPLQHNQPDVDDPSTGFLWDNLARHGVSYRVYGEFVTSVWCRSTQVNSPKEGTPSAQTESCPRQQTAKGEPLPEYLGDPRGGPSPWPWAVPGLKQVRPTKAALRDHFDPLYPEFETDYPDQLRADEFLNEFNGFVRARADGKGTELPAFVLLYLPNDHTAGTRPGKPTPMASVADNDLALGRVVDAVSHSPYWNDTAIMVLEDDAQDGADHVDAHRSIAFVISKYSPGSVTRPFVENHFFTTVNMIHTIELLLGLPPMNLNDAYAPAMTQLFSGKGEQPAYSADFSNRDNGLLYTVNSRKAPGSKESSRMDFSRPDAANTKQLNAILWRDAKGAKAMPAPVHP